MDAAIVDTGIDGNLRLSNPAFKLIEPGGYRNAFWVIRAPNVVHPLCF